MLVVPGPWPSANTSQHESCLEHYSSQAELAAVVSSSALSGTLMNVTGMQDADQTLGSRDT